MVCKGSGLVDNKKLTRWMSYLNPLVDSAHRVTALAPNHYNRINATQGNLEYTLGTLWEHSEITQKSLWDHSENTHFIGGAHPFGSAVSEHVGNVLPSQPEICWKSKKLALSDHQDHPIFGCMGGSDNSHQISLKSCSVILPTLLSWIILRHLTRQNCAACLEEFCFA